MKCDVKDIQHKIRGYLYLFSQPYKQTQWALFFKQKGEVN